MGQKLLDKQLTFLNRMTSAKEIVKCVPIVSLKFAKEVIKVRENTQSKKFSNKGDIENIRRIDRGIGDAGALLDLIAWEEELLSMLNSMETAIELVDGFPGIPLETARKFLSNRNSFPGQKFGSIPDL